LFDGLCYETKRNSLKEELQVRSSS
jgi:hypothetical protein